jgi:phenylalanyl-tRNA synthetase alpha subunit
MTDLSSSVAALRAEFDAALAAVATAADLQALRDRFLGRKHGLVTALYAEIGKAPAEQKREIGRLANELKQAVEAGLEARKDTLGATATRAAGLDLTLAPRPLPVGSRHPLNAMRERIERIFVRMGYEILDGPETEDDWHCFEALNMPAEHPARDAQDTLYLEQPFVQGTRATGEPGAGVTLRPATLLRTHTSAMQIRYMEQHAPPIRIIAPGRVYRRDNLDLTHTPMFQQVEALVVGEQVTMADLKGTLLASSSTRRRRSCSSPRSSRTPSRAPRCSSAASRASARAARCASAPAGSRSAAAAWSTRRCSRPSASTRSATPASRSAWASSASRCSPIAWTTSARSTKTTFASWSSSRRENPRLVVEGVRRRPRRDRPTREGPHHARLRGRVGGPGRGARR